MILEVPSNRDDAMILYMIVTELAALGLGARLFAVLPVFAEALGTGFTVHFVGPARVTGVTGLRESPVMRVNKTTGSFAGSGAPSIGNGLLMKW